MTAVQHASSAICWKKWQGTESYTSCCVLVRVLTNIWGAPGAAVSSLLASFSTANADANRTPSKNTCDREETSAEEFTSKRKGVKGGSQMSHDKSADAV